MYAKVRNFYASPKMNADGSYSLQGFDRELDSSSPAQVLREPTAKVAPVSNYALNAQGILPYRYDYATIYTAYNKPGNPYGWKACV